MVENPQVTAASPGVSVVMVNFNGGPLVVEAVERVLRARGLVDLLVVDNGSRDGSAAQLAAMAESVGPLQLTLNGRNRGFAAACNQALGGARGDFLLLLNPDCLIETETLVAMMEVMAAYPQVGMAGCRIQNPDGSEQRGCRRALPDLASALATALGGGGRKAGAGINRHQQPLPPGPQEVEAISGAFMLVRRTAFEQVGPLDEGYFLHCEDLDWCRRFADAGWGILFVPEVRVVHHQGTCSRTRPLPVEWHKHRGMLRYYRKFIRPSQSLPMNLLVWLGVWGRFLWVAGRSLLAGGRSGG